MTAAPTPDFNTDGVGDIFSTKTGSLNLWTGRGVDNFWGRTRVGDGWDAYPRLLLPPMPSALTAQAATAQRSTVAASTRASAICPSDGQPLIVDLDATIIISHSSKQHAAPPKRKGTASTR
ncbi:hypothetical protein GBF35_29510 [Nonomuraea phyllanthi]|uniref:hypothetical protein n=1 Tax=Nonomuraea phyllanthi TaxID=2219224 RepID=UPI0012934A3C|nr:hypothetical protein [Nonomuraea phyllanthi]QFY10218.1 hypothetical protein GBF35_29510 [Nonomuraea phyllanthi]